jgi:tRNA G10  N-methylase Trm11
MQFRHLEFLGAIAALSNGEPSLETLLRGCAADVASVNPVNSSNTFESYMGTLPDDVLVSFENALSYTGPHEDRVSAVKRARYDQAMQFVRFHDESIRRAMTRELLSQAVERCSLIHTMYEVVADSSPPPSEAAEPIMEIGIGGDNPHRQRCRYDDLTRNALANGAFADMRVDGENERASWCLRVRQYGDLDHDDTENESQPNGLSQRRRDRIPHLRHAGKKTRSMEKEREALLALRPLLSQLGGAVNLRSPDTKIYVLDGLVNGTALLTRRLASGGHRLASSIAPNTRICVTNTPLCPVAAFALCNVAGVKGNQSILDPYAGSGAILLAASLIDGKSGTVGIEIAHDGLVNREDLRRDFATRRLPQPLALIKGDSTDVEVRRQARLAIGDVPFDLIITDPPYGIRESTIRSVPILDLLNAIASDRKAGRRLLKKGGKLVCFVPCQENESLGSVLPDAQQMNEAGLRFESIREQPLNSKLSRWLVSLICYR